MEFLDINLTTDFCSMLFTVPYTIGFDRKPHSTLGLEKIENTYKKSAKSILFMNSF
jgi:hypothetical protein